MKITATLLLIVTLQASAKSWGQEKINLSFSNAPLTQVLNSITSQAGVSFFYRPQYVKDKKVTVSISNADLKTVLDVCLKGQELLYEIVGKTVAIHPVKGGGKISLDEISVTTSATDGELKGRVLTKEGEPLVSASVVNKRTGKGTTTDANGKFVLSEVNKDDIIVISYTGYSPRSIRAGEFSSALTLVMEPASNELDQVVMQAYGTTTRRFNTGNISRISGEDISNQPVSNPLAALSGRVPGLLITQNGGLPGSSYKIQLRGQSSIGLTAATLPPNDPLFIIDGVPFAANNDPLNRVTSALGSAGLSPLNMINPFDIESIEVLKDADATAIYGSRGANGVVLITTKKGRLGKSKVSFNFYTGWSKTLTTMDLLSTPQYVEMRREALSNDGKAFTQANAPDLFLWDTTRNTDFKRLLIGNTAKTTDAQASLSGGNDRTQFLMGTGYHRETTVFPGEMASSRGTFSLNLTHESKDHKFKANVSTLYSISNTNLPSSDLTYSLLLAPHAPTLYDSIGNLKWAENGVAFYNPLSYLKREYEANTNNTINHLLLSYTILSGLTVRTSFGYNYLNNNEIMILPIGSQDPSASPKGSSSFASNEYRGWIIEPQAEYTHKFGRFRVAGLIGGTWQELENRGSSIAASGYTSDALLKSLKGAATLSATNDNSEYHYSAAFGRITFNLAEKYIVNLSGRRDGSSRFGPNNRFGNFGAVGAAWIFSDEAFIKNAIASFLSFGKLRASYGTTGNDQIGDYNYLDLWDNTQWSYQGIPGLRPMRIYNPNFSWEENRKLEGAIELGFLHNRILFTGAYFRNRSSNQLVSYSVPSQTGFASVTTMNFPAVVQNSGLELSLSTENIKSNNFSWSSSVTLTVPRNKLVSFPELASSPYASALVVGKSLSIRRGYHSTGLDPATGLFTVEDLDGDGAIKSINDFITIGDMAPRYYGGMNNTFSYKGWQLNVFFEGRKQIGQSYLSRIYSNNPPGVTGAYGQLGNQPMAVLDRWRKPNDVATFEKYTSANGTLASNAAVNFYNSDAAYVDASFIRLKTTNISYEVPTKLVRKLQMETIRVFMQGQNLLTITNYEGTDPETQSVFGLPPLRTITVGIRVTF